MRLKSAAFFAVGFLSAGFWLHGNALAQSPVGPPLSLAPPPLGTNQGSSAAPTSNQASPGVSSPPAAKGSRPPAVTNAWPPTETDDVPPPTATAKRSTPSAAARNAPPAANSKDAQPSATEDIPPPRVITAAPPPVITGSSSPKPATDYDGFIVGIDEDEDTGRPAPAKPPRPAKQSKVRQKPAEGPSTLQPPGSQAEIETTKPKLTICQGC